MGTYLFQAVVLNAWGLVASATSGTFADQNHWLLWPVAALLNVFVFSLVAVPGYFMLRQRAPRLCAGLLVLWLLLHLMLLFVLFPASDGP